MIISFGENNLKPDLKQHINSFFFYLQRDQIVSKYLQTFHQEMKLHSMFAKLLQRTATPLPTNLFNVLSSLKTHYFTETGLDCLEQIPNISINLKAGM